MRCACLLVIFAGCQSHSDSATITGSISLDGKPVEGGLIRFVPVDGQSQPSDSTIVAGVYTASLSPGEKRVEITWLKTDGPPEDTASQGKSKSVQMIPAKYNSKSTLTFTVVAGKQSKDFELTTK